MSDASTKRMIDMYMEDASAPMFLSGFFQSPPRNFHNGEEVEIDIERDDEEIAIVLTDHTTGPRKNEATTYTNKTFVPPIFEEEGEISAFSLMKRRAGQDPFQDPNFNRNATEEAFKVFRRLEKKIRRSVELMASQVLTEGVLSLTDDAGSVLYTLDFQAKASHLATVGTDWTSAGAGNHLADLEALGTIVRRDGKQVPTDLIFGTDALISFLASTDVQARLDNRRMELGKVTPQTRGMGATFQGEVWIGHYRYRMWTYDGFYRDPQTGLHVPYIPADYVLMLSEAGRLDLSWGALPFIRRPEAGPLSFIPPRMMDSGRGLDLTTNAWITNDNRHLKVSAGTRPLTIPTAIDTFARLDTVM